MEASNFETFLIEINKLKIENNLTKIIYFENYCENYFLAYSEGLFNLIGKSNFNDFKKIQSNISNISQIKIFPNIFLIFLLLYDSPTIQVIDYKCFDFICELKGHSEEVNYLIKLSNIHIASISKNDKSIFVWSLENFSLKLKIEKAHRLNLCFLCNIGYLKFISNGSEGRFKIWSYNEDLSEIPIIIFTSKKYESLITCLELINNNFCIGFDDGKIKVFNSITFLEIYEINYIENILKIISLENDSNKYLIIVNVKGNTKFINITNDNIFQENNEIFLNLEGLLNIFKIKNNTTIGVCQHNNSYNILENIVYKFILI